MRETTKYHFNLIDTSDTFSPEALNKNTEVVETELARVEAEAASDKTELLTAIGSGGKTARITWGSYVGAGGTGKQNAKVLELDFKPLIVFLWNGVTTATCEIMVRPDTYAIGTLLYVEWEDHAVKWYQHSENTNMNTKGVTFYYIAIGADD